ncbi:hypothetical protein [Sneathiella sp. HT1-7]|uniref:hypothetical protein n=1 Tax=Sneathiella sp. HT1-7 TaxID=2887192 RepID=UPI001D146323|nr:hypothetical protein [Sneathiella sp. HT1-7]MCC3303208.1 hypothetical protein [Sneathiella sp. HT1-7]
MAHTLLEAVKHPNFSLYFLDFIVGYNETYGGAWQVQQRKLRQIYTKKARNFFRALFEYYVIESQAAFSTF